MIKLNIAHILIFVIIIFLINYLLSRCRCNRNNFKVGGQFGEWWDENVRSTSVIQSLEDTTDDIDHTLTREYNRHTQQHGGSLVQTIEDNTSQGLENMGDVAVTLSEGPPEGWDGVLVNSVTEVGMSLTYNERTILNNFDHNCQRGTQANREVCQLLDNIGFDSLIEKAGFIANIKRISDNAHDIIVNINILNDAKSSVECTQLFGTAEAILISAITTITGPMSVGIDFIVATIGVGIVAACSAIELSNIPDEERENISYTLAGWVQYRLGPLISGSKDDIYIPAPENNYMTDIFDPDIRRFVKYNPRFITENIDDADNMCESSIDICSELTEQMENIMIAKKVFNKVKNIYAQRYLNPTPQRTKKKYMYATLASAVTFAAAENSDYDMNKCIGTQQLLSCRDNYNFSSGEDYRHLAEEYETNVCNLYKKRENISEDIPCCEKNWNTNISSVDTHVDENNITRSIFIKNDGTKCVSPPHYINVQNHSNPSIKRLWNSSKNTYYNNRPQ
tara:strand:- start:900 stop:2423 length:1524 start_codon:yes stop_codon:yes gene_type:complete